MQSTNIIKSLNNKISARHLQFLAHWVYILMSLQLYQSIWPFLNLAIAYCVIFIFMFVGKKYLSQDYFDHSYLSVFVVCNSAYLNVLYDYHYLILFPILALVAVNIKLFFRKPDPNRSLLNPAFSAIFVLSLCFPQFYNYGPTLWSSEWWQILTLLFIGTYITYRARTIILAYSYLVAFIIFSFVIGGVMHLLKFPAVASPFSWVIGLLSFVKLLFIFHVISDPASGPTGLKAQIVFGSSIAFFEILLKYLNVLNNVAIGYILTLTLYHIVDEIYSKKNKAEVMKESPA